MLLVVAAVAFSAAPKASPLVGTWLRAGAAICTLNADGSGQWEGDAFRWRADAKTIVVVDEEEGERRIPYTLKGNRLTVRIEGELVTLERGKASKEGGLLSQLLLSSAWCTFRYNQTTGYSSSTRIVFAPSGIWQSSSRGEGGSSGAGGSYASQSDSGSSGRYRASGNALWMAEGEEPLQPVPLQMKQNSNGAPIIVADGREYSQCR